MPVRPLAIWRWLLTAQNYVVTCAQLTLMSSTLSIPVHRRWYGNIYRLRKYCFHQRKTWAHMHGCDNRCICVLDCHNLVVDGRV